MITPFTTPQELAKNLGTSYSKINYFIYKKPTTSLYYSFEINKKNGGERLIQAPISPLLLLQKRLKIELESLYKPHRAASAFIHERGIVYNAKQHTKKALVLNLDLKDFYHQIHFGRVRGLLISKPYSLDERTATYIAHICCVNKVIPQGAPTSPVISNMICRRLDRELSFLAKRNKMFYTRYADDITFSSRFLKSNKVLVLNNEEFELGKQLIKIIEDNGFSINEQKTRLQKYNERQVVTGLKVNRKVNVDRRYVRTTRAMLFSLTMDGEYANEKYKNTHENSTNTIEKVVAGRINFIGMVKGKHSSVYQTLVKKFNCLDLNLKLPEGDNKSVGLRTIGNQNIYFQRNQIEKKLWVVSFEGVEGLEMDQELTQGTAFMIIGNKLMTAYHTFVKAGNPQYCYVFRLPERKRYKAKLMKFCKISDTAMLELEEVSEKFECFILAPSKKLYPGYKLKTVGFPQFLDSHETFTILNSEITNSFIKNTLQWYEVNSNYHGGISGAPVINDYNQVIGMALTGFNATVDFESQTSGFEGRNSFVSSCHFLETCPESSKKIRRNKDSLRYTRKNNQ